MTLRAAIFASVIGALTSSCDNRNVMQRVADERRASGEANCTPIRAHDAQTMDQLSSCPPGYEQLAPGEADRLQRQEDAARVAAAEARARAQEMQQRAEQERADRNSQLAEMRVGADESALTALHANYGEGTSLEASRVINDDGKRVICGRFRLAHGPKGDFALTENAFYEVGDPIYTAAAQLNRPGTMTPEVISASQFMQMCHFRTYAQP